MKLQVNFTLCEILQLSYCDVIQHDNIVSALSHQTARAERIER